MKNLLFIILFYFSHISFLWASSDASSLLLSQEKKIISSSKDEESVFDSAASVFVLNSQDIMRSGATSLPELLRLVPGVEVTQSSSSKWSVTIRGFGRMYDNKVLVLIDGREMYSSVFSGANWDVSGVVLKDIERIEVIRGSATNMWGANSLNGVINIITKKSEFTQGNYASITHGNKEEIKEFRHGGKYNDKIFYRAYGKKVYRDQVKSVDKKRGRVGDKANDAWDMDKAGFRIDFAQSAQNDIVIQGDMHSGEMSRNMWRPENDNDPVHDIEKAWGFNIDTQFTHKFNDSDKVKAHIYIDKNKRTSLFEGSNRDVMQFQLEYHLKTHENNNLKMGAGVRHTKDELYDGVYEGVAYNEFGDNSFSTNLYSGFLQNKYSLIPDMIDIITGIKFEHHYKIGMNYMPSAQVKYKPNDDNILWASISKSKRQPSIWELYMRRKAYHYDGIGFVHWQANEDSASEEMISYQMGYRNRSLSRFEFDISFFRNEYDNVRSFEQNLVEMQYEMSNKSSAKITGFNTAINFSALQNWNLFLGYSYNDMDLYFDTDSTDNISIYDDAVTPRHQIQFLSRYNVAKNIDFDVNLHYVSKILESYHAIDSYYRADIRVAWRPIKDLELSAVGQNLFIDDYQQTSRTFFGSYNAVYSNSFYLKLDYDF